MPQCVFSATHDAPFYSCSVCGQTVCHACVARRFPTGAVRCVGCETIARKLDPDRYTYKTTRPDLTWTVAPPARKSSLGAAFGGIGRFVGSFFSSITAPFTRPGLGPSRSEFHIGITFTTFNDKLFAVALLVLFIVAVTLFAVIYADSNALPFWRAMLGIIATCFAGLIVAVYCRHWFDRPLGYPASPIASYVLGALVAILVLSLLLGL